MCDKCGIAFKDKNRLRDHYSRVHSVPDQECPNCHGFFTKRQMKNNHEMTCGKEKICPQCNKEVKNLEKHMIRKHMPDSEKPHQCSICQKGFSGRKSLRDHTVNVHTKTRPYPCRYGCDIAYNDNSNRNQHEKRKHGKLFTAANK